jgi:hypothetical protein
MKARKMGSSILENKTLNKVRKNKAQTLMKVSKLPGSKSTSRLRKISK